MLDRDRTALLVVDVQERLVPHMLEPERMLERMEVLLRGAQTLGLPIVLTEQYRKGLGPTVSRLTDLVPALVPLEKISFGCGEDPAIVAALRTLGRPQILICGIEAHVCVLQTALQLRGLGFEVQVVADAVSSRAARSVAVALERMSQEGIRWTSVETCLFELLRRAGTDEFREISRLVR